MTAEQASKEGPGLVNMMKQTGKSADGKRIRIFRKVIREGEGKNATYKETDLSVLDKAILKEMLGQYNSFLNATGKTMWENSGEQRAPKFDDVMSAAEEWSNFNKNITDSIYYKLRRRRIPDTNRKWHDDKEFKQMFKVEEKTYFDKQTQKNKKYSSVIVF